MPGRRTVVVVVPVLLPLTRSVVVEAATALLVITVRSAVAGLTLTTTSNVAVSPLATVPFEKTTLPVPPPAGWLEMLHPGPVVIAAETKVVFVGTASVTVTLLAALGPLLVKLIV